MSELIVISVNLEYFYCRECKDEVILTAYLNEVDLLLESTNYLACENNKTKLQLAEDQLVSLKYLFEYYYINNSKS